MHKTTIFTVILSVLVIGIVSELLFNNYLSAEEGKVSILTSQDLAHPSLIKADSATQSVAPTNDTTNQLGDLTFDQEDINNLVKGDSFESEPDESVLSMSIEDIISEPSKTDDSVINGSTLPQLTNNDTGSVVTDLELVATSSSDTHKGVNDDSLKLAGFVDVQLIDTDFNGQLFQTLDIADMNLAVKKQYIASKSEVFGAVYSFSVDESRQIEVYKMLRERAAFGTEVETNETNTYGDNSFYMNDARRENTAFLLVRSADSFYAFAYPKKFHEYFKALSSNL